MRCCDSLEKFEGFDCESTGGKQVLHHLLTDRRAARQQRKLSIINTTKHDTLKGRRTSEALQENMKLKTSISRDVGEVQRRRRREDVVKIFGSGFFEAVQGGA